MDVDQRYRDASACSRATIRLADIGPAGFLKPLNLSNRVGDAGLGEQRQNITAAAFKNTEDVARFDGLPGGQRIETRKNAVF